jgi:hypothetical protein
MPWGTADGVLDVGLLLVWGSGFLPSVPLPRPDSTVLHVVDSERTIPFDGFDPTKLRRKLGQETLQLF